MNTLIKGTAFSGRDSNLTPHPHPEYEPEKLRLGPSCTNVWCVYCIHCIRKQIAVGFNLDGIDF